MARPRWIATLLMLQVALGLGACGGGSDDPAPTDPLAGAAWVAGSVPPPVDQGDRVADPAFRLVDAGGRPLAGVPVAISVDGGGSVVPATTTTDPDGRVSPIWTAGLTLGPQHLEVRADAVAAVATVEVRPATPGTPKSIVIVSGDRQTVRQHGTLAAPLVVRVTDAFGHGVAGVAVTFSPVPASVTIPPSTVTTASSPTGSEGTTRFEQAWWHAAGTKIVEATAGGVGAVAFTVTVTPNDHVFDGRFTCRMINTKSEGHVVIDIVEGLVLAPFLGPIHAGYPTFDFVLDEATGTLTGDTRASSEVHYYDFNAQVEAAADDTATIDGTYMRYAAYEDEIDGPKPGVLSCVRL